MAKKKEESASMNLNFNNSDNNQVNSNNTSQSHNTSNSNNVTHNYFGEKDTKKKATSNTGSSNLKKSIITALIGLAITITGLYIKKNFSGDGHIPGSVKTPIPSTSR